MSAFIKGPHEPAAGIADIGRVNHLHYAEALILGKFALKVAAEGFSVKRMQDGNHDVAPDIVVTDPMIVENAVRVDKFGPVAFDAINLGGAFGPVDLEKHDPAGGRKKEFKFWEFAPHKRIEIVIPQGFVVKKN